MKYVRTHDSLYVPLGIECRTKKIETEKEREREEKVYSNKLLDKTDQSSMRLMNAQRSHNSK